MHFANERTVKMPDRKNEASRLDLYKAGKLDERRDSRKRATIVEEAKETEVEEAASHLRPEIIALGVLVIALLVITLVAL
jgi:hypothetical protein